MALKFGDVSLDDDTRSKFGSHALGGVNSTSTGTGTGGAPSTLSTILFRHSDHLVWTPLGGISSTATASVNDVGFVMILAARRTSTVGGRGWSVAVVDCGAFHRGSLMRSFPQHRLEIERWLVPVLFVVIVVPAAYHLQLVYRIHPISRSTRITINFVFELPVVSAIDVVLGSTLRVVTVVAASRGWRRLTKRNRRRRCILPGAYRPGIVEII